MEKTSKNNHLIRLCTAAMFAALICVGTIIIVIPTPFGGNVNLGDCFILVGAWILGPVYGAAAGAVGSAIADLFSGYALYAPATFIIKGLIGLLAALIAKGIAAKAPTLKNLGYVLGALSGEAVMILGYFVFEATVAGYGITGAAANIPYNTVQGMCGMTLGVVLIHIAHKTNLLTKFSIFKS